MGKKSGAKAEVVEYRMAIHLGLCGVVDRIKSIHLNKKLVWSGSQSTNGLISILKPNLFGGYEREGGPVGDVFVLLGRDNQVLPADLASRLGKTSTTCPAYRGKTTLFFIGNRAVTNPNQKKGFIGLLNLALGGIPANAQMPANAPTPGGFMWSFNNPLLAQDVWVEVERAPVGLDPNYAMIMGDANAAHIIWEAYTNPRWGMGESELMMDRDAYEAAAVTLYNESFGLSLRWSQPTTIEDFVTEILSHIQAVTYLDPSTGLHTIKLLRNDYDVETLPELTPQNSRLLKFAERMAGEIVNEVTVGYTNPANGETVTVTEHNLASLNAQGKVGKRHDYLGIRRTDLATMVAARDVRIASAPLVSAEVEVDRRFWNVNPGALLRFNYPDKSDTVRIMRVGKVNRGRPGASKIRLELLEDIYSLAQPEIAAAPETEWQDPGEEPEAISVAQILTTPAYFVATGVLQNGLTPLDYPEVTAVVLAHPTGLDTLNYDLVADFTLPDGTTTKRTLGSKSLAQRTELTDDLAAEASSSLPGNLVVSSDHGPAVGGFVFIGGADADHEIALISDFTENDWIITRGLLDTTPKAWPAGTPIWFVNAGMRLVDTTIRSAFEEVDYQLLTRTSRGILALDDAPVETAMLTERPHLPLRPANVKVNGSGFGPYDATGQANLALTWSTRNRQLEEGQTVAWDAEPVAPEYRQMTVIRVVDPETESEIITYRFWTDTNFTIPTSEFARWASVRFEFSSARNDLVSLQSHAIEVTGLADDPGAPEPSPAPELGEAPLTQAAPGLGVYTIIGGSINAPSGNGRQPAIVLEGKPDNTAATHLLVRYRRNSSSSWNYRSAITLTGEKQRFVVTGVAALTLYENVEVAYVIGGIPSQWRAVGSVTTGAAISTDTEFVDGTPSAEVIARIFAMETSATEILANVEAIQAQAEQTLERSQMLAQAILRRSIDQFQSDARRQALDFIGGEQVGVVFQRENSERIENETYFAENFSLMGARSLDGESWIMDLDTVLVSPTQSWAERLTQISTEFDDLALFFTEEIDLVVNDVEAIGEVVSLLGTPDGTNFILDLDKLKVSPTETMATRLSAINTSLGANASAIATETTNRTTAVSAVASSVTTLSTTVGSHTSTLTSYGSSIDGLLARAGLVLNVNGHITGWTLNNDGSSGDFNVLANKFAVVTPGGTPYVPFEVVDGVTRIKSALIQSLGVNKLSGGTLNAPINVGSGRFVFDTGTYMLVIGGAGFGSSNQFIFWYGPSQTSLSGCNTTNAICYFTIDGKSKLSGPFVTLPSTPIEDTTIRFSNSTGSTSSTASMELEDVTSEGGDIAVTLNYGLQGYFQDSESGTWSPGLPPYWDGTDDGVIDYLDETSGVEAIVTLERSVGGGSYSLVDTLYVYGGHLFRAQGGYDGLFTTGGSYSVNIDKELLAADQLIFSDTLHTTDVRKYRATITSRNLSGWSETFTQSITINTAEET